jgi:hypothetical protein
MAFGKTTTQALSTGTPRDTYNTNSTGAAHRVAAASTGQPQATTMIVILIVAPDRLLTGSLVIPNVRTGLDRSRMNRARLTSPRRHAASPARAVA